jgi:aryl-alcohol dehydrogenase-like predicted oxidoreductase
MRGDKESLKKDVDYALEQLGTDYIDVIVLCRVPGDVPIEESVQGMKEIVQSGKARHIGLSEASAATIKRAAKVHPIYCIEQEWSLWSRDIEPEIVPTCRELGIKIVAYSPLGRGFLTGSIKDRSDLKDYRLMSPKFSEDNFQKNLRLVEIVETIAKKKGVTAGQVALAWLHAQGPDVIPIPGTTTPKHFDDNHAALKVQLSKDEVNQLSEVFKPEAVHGERYAGNHNTFHQN